MIITWVILMFYQQQTSWQHVMPQVSTAQIIINIKRGALFHWSSVNGYSTQWQYDNKHRLINMQQIEDTRR